MKVALVASEPCSSATSSVPSWPAGQLGAPASAQVELKADGLDALRIEPVTEPPKSANGAPGVGENWADERDHVGIFCSLVRSSQRSAAETRSSALTATSLVLIFGTAADDEASFATGVAADEVVVGAEAAGVLDPLAEPDAASGAASISLP